MLKKKSGQIDMFSHMIFEKLIPKDHLLVKIDSIIDFSFVYEKVKDKYNNRLDASLSTCQLIGVKILGEKVF